jgi:hypothetical protein
MKDRLIAAGAILLLLGGSLSAHRLDQYLQAAMISVAKDHVDVSMRMIPGVAVSEAVLVSIDSNGDSVISETEGRAYAERVLDDLSLTLDGRKLNPKLVSAKFPAIEDIKEGLGEIQINFTADLPPGDFKRQLVFENHYQSAMAAYLVNCLVPADPNIRIVGQNRNTQQSFYQLDYQQAGSHESVSTRWTMAARQWVDFFGFGSMFRLGMRHIAEGTDHLLFLLALLLPTPLLAIGAHWSGIASVRQSLPRILRVVTAFTAGHSLTLALAGLGFVHVPSRPIEALIAISILVSAIHALRPIFPGREAGIAGFFGLIHGLAFATTLSQLGLSRWERVGNLLAFNVGIETMQLIVVAATLPSLVLLSRTRAYSFLRIGGALFAGMASAGWIAERLLGIHTSVDTVVDMVAHRAIWVAVGLFAMSLACWAMRGVRDTSNLERVDLFDVRRVQG